MGGVSVRPLGIAVVSSILLHPVFSSSEHNACEYGLSERYAAVESSGDLLSSHDASSVD
jgi:hypothetical protein